MPRFYITEQAATVTERVYDVEEVDDFDASSIEADPMAFQRRS